MSIRTFEVVVFIIAFAFAVVVILIVLALFFKNSKLKIKDWFQIETEAKDCKFKNSNKELEDHFVANAIENNNRLDYLKNKSIDYVKDNYKDIINVKNQITELNIYKEYSMIVLHTTFSVLYKLFEFLKENHIVDKSTLEITQLSKKRANELITLYDEAFKKSSYQSIKELSIKRLSGGFYYIVQNLIKETYMDIYSNYSKNISERKEKVNNFIDNNIELECMNKFINVVPIMDATFNKITNNNLIILMTMSSDIINLLLGIFYDKLKE